MKSSKSGRRAAARLGSVAAVVLWIESSEQVADGSGCTHRAGPFHNRPGYDARRPLTATGTNPLGESNRYAGHADILREGLDGRTGVRPGHEQQIDHEAQAVHCAKIEQAARSAAASGTVRHAPDRSHDLR